MYFEKMESKPWFSSFLHIPGYKGIRSCVVLDPTVNKTDGVVIRVVVCFEKDLLGVKNIKLHMNDSTRIRTGSRHDSTH